MLLAEELALVALDLDTGRHGLGRRDQMNACLAGLLIGELLLTGTAAPAERRNRVVLGSGPVPASPLLAAAAQVVAEKGPKISSVLSHMSSGLESQLGQGTWDAAVAGLVQAGALGPASGGLRSRNEVLDVGGREAVIARLQRTAGSDDPMELRTALVLSMTGPAHLLEVVAPDRRGRKHARRRIDHALDGTPCEELGKVVRKVLADADASVAFVASS